MYGQAVLPLPAGWPAPREEVEPTPGAPRFHPRSLARATLDEGGCFDYSSAPELFLGRTGFGPLRVAWDTNILIDWRDFGGFLLSEDGERLPGGLDALHEEDLVALGEVMNLVWMTRDIRICPLNRQLYDFGRRRSRRSDLKLVQERTRQLDELASALWCVGLGRDLMKAGGYSPTRLWQATWMGRSPDRALVEEAITSGSHVFLTRDGKILRHGRRLAALGLVTLRPSGFLDALLEAGELYSPGGPDGMICDDHKFLHLRAAAGTG